MPNKGFQQTVLKALLKKHRNEWVDLNTITASVQEIRPEIERKQVSGAICHLHKKGMVAYGKVEGTYKLLRCSTRPSKVKPVVDEVENPFKCKDETVMPISSKIMDMAELNTLQSLLGEILEVIIDMEKVIVSLKGAQCGTTSVS